MPIKTNHMDQVAVVTGAGRGIGRAIAIAYAEAGMRVICAARSAAQIEMTVSAILEQGGQAQACVCDVANADQVGALYEFAVHAFGGIDLVLVNAGIGGPRTPVAETQIDDWLQVQQVNLYGAYLQSRLAIDYLVKRGGGKIIFMGSGVGRNAIPGSSAYACSKAAVAMLSRVLAVELRDQNIAVNEIIPGPVRTSMTGVPEEREIDDGDGAPILSVPGEWAKDPSDVVPIALFVAGLPNNGPSGQSYSLTRRDLGRS